MWVIVRGGLGNQMFQAAFAFALAKRFSSEVRFLDFTADAREPRTWQLSVFGIRPFRAGLARRFLVAGQVVTASYLKKLGRDGSLNVLLEPTDPAHLGSLVQRPTVVSGYWQSELYFKDVVDLVNSTFVFPRVPRPGTTHSQKTSGAVVAIHVRRGDYADDRIAREKHLVCDPEWYRRAWTHMRNLINDCRALVFSDDQAWAHEELQLDGRVEYFGAGRPGMDWLDMAHMTDCDHFIISNSSYGWWAAYLSKSPSKIVIAPRFWYRHVETAAIRACPDHWLLLP